MRLYFSPAKLRRINKKRQVGENAPACLFFQNVLNRFRDSSVPLSHADLLPVLPLLQPIIGAVILHLHRGAVGFSLGLLAVSADLPAGMFCPAGSNVVAAASVISCRQQEILPAVMAAAGVCFPPPIPGRIPSAEGSFPGREDDPLKPGPVPVPTLLRPQGAA